MVSETNLHQKFWGVNGHLKIKAFNNLKIENHDEIKINIEKKIKNIKVHKSNPWSGFIELTVHTHRVF